MMIYYTGSTPTTGLCSVGVPSTPSYNSATHLREWSCDTTFIDVNCIASTSYCGDGVL